MEVAAIATPLSALDTLGIMAGCTPRARRRSGTRMEAAAIVTPKLSALLLTLGMMAGCNPRGSSQGLHLAGSAKA